MGTFFETHVVLFDVVGRKKIAGSGGGVQTAPGTSNPK